MGVTAVRLANAILIAGVAGSGIVFVYVLYLAETLLTSAAHAWFFVGCPALGAVACSAALRLNPVPRVLVALSLASVALALYGAEAFLATYPSGSAPPNEVGEVPFDTRTKYEVVRDYRRAGTRAYPSVFPAYLLKRSIDGSLHSPLVVDGQEILPLAGVAEAFTVLCNESGSYVTYESDENGFNNPKGLWAAARMRVAVLGDSFVQGYCTPPDQSFVSLIRDRFPRTLNTGMSGSGPLLMLASLKEYAATRAPEIVLWAFYEGNDIPGNLAVERRSPLLMRYLEPDFRQGLLAKDRLLRSRLASHVDALIEEEDTRRETDAGLLQLAIGFATLSRLRSELGLPLSTGDPDYGLFKRILAEARRVVGSWGGAFVFVYLPGYGSAVAADDTRGPLGDIRDSVLAIANGLSIPIIDLMASFRNHPDPASLFPFRHPGHYNAEGHALVAKAILSSIAPTIEEDAE